MLVEPPDDVHDLGQVSRWEAEFCRIAESHSRVRAYVENHNLGFEVLYRWFSENRRYILDFLLRIGDGHGEEDLLNLIVEIRDYRDEDAREKKSRPLGLCRVY